MADDDDEDLEAEVAQDADAGQGAERFEIQQVWSVKSTRGNAPWYPSTSMEDGTVYIRLSKWDSQLTKMVLGKGMNRHKAHGEVRTLNVLWWQEVAKLRILAICICEVGFNIVCFGLCFQRSQFMQLDIL